MSQNESATSNQPIVTYKTTTTNISAYMNTGIGLSQLPQTIVDAIHVTNALECQYLWADTLCIIQDSDIDTLHELARMHHIYRHAYVTIIAASAQKVSEGFLQLRKPLVQVPQWKFTDSEPLLDVRLPFICPPDPCQAPTRRNKVVQQVGEVHISPLYTDKDGWIDRAPSSLSTEPISARAWCMQEYLISPRALIFTKETLRFRCHTATRNIGDAFYDHWQSQEQGLPDVLFNRRPPVIKPLSDYWRYMHFVWDRIVEDYCRRSITVESDKLVACGVIAQEFQRVLRADYLAGLWRDSLVQDLIWQRDGTKGELPRLRPAAYRAPSWSWAAVEGPILLERPFKTIPGPPLPRKEIAQVVRCEVTPKDAANPFGEVAGGALLLRGALIKMRILGMWGGEEGILWRRLYLEPPADTHGRGMDGSLLGAQDEGACIRTVQDEDGDVASQKPSPPPSPSRESVSNHSSLLISETSSRSSMETDQNKSVNHTAGIVKMDGDEDIGIDTTWFIPLVIIGVAVHGVVVTLASEGRGGSEQQCSTYRRVAYCEIHDHELDDRGWNVWKLPTTDIELV
ncbi:heterokaryon incompatibility protein-domain-containing protein [Trametes gibbosa]|nr:heterokaryon incompatibility protein-domain-containing protein [Trametes gibbosa]